MAVLKVSAVRLPLAVLAVAAVTGGAAGAGGSGVMLPQRLIAHACQEPSGLSEFKSFFEYRRCSHTEAV